ncbi:MAG: TIGR01459 family HAD-type hydrolase [Sphingomicrobium sp.]
MSPFWRTLDTRYRAIFCDVWGVVHDGVRLYPFAAERLRGWRGEGRQVILVTNAPRTADSVEQQLARIGLPNDCWDGIATSGEAGIAALAALGRPVGSIGTPGDRAVLEGRGVAFAEGDGFTDLACTGIDGVRGRAEDYRAELDACLAAGVTLHCLNPDRIVIRDRVEEVCAGAIADLYEAMGGRVEWYGKPHAHIYEHALHLAGNPPIAAVLAVGDSLRTDVLGAARMGFDTVFVAGGIHRGADISPSFAAENGLGDWRPVAIVDGLD